MAVWDFYFASVLCPDVSQRIRYGDGRAFGGDRNGRQTVEDANADSGKEKQCKQRRTDRRPWHNEVSLVAG